MVARRSAVQAFRAASALSLLPLIALVGVSEAPTAHAAGFGLEDDSAVVIGSDGVIYSLNLATAAATAGQTISNDTFTYLVSGLEANPSNDTLFAVNQASAPNTNVLASVVTTTGVSTFIEDDYGADYILNGIDRSNAGTAYLSLNPDSQAGPTNYLATVDLTTGAEVPIGETSVGGVNKVLVAIVSDDDELYGFARAETDAVYSIDTATGGLTLKTAATGTISGPAVVGADATVDGTVYLMTIDDGDDNYLYFTDLAGTTTLVGQVTGFPAGVKAENLAIATLLDSERTEPEQPGEDNGDNRRDDDDDDEVVVVAPAPPLQPELAPTGAHTSGIAVGIALFLVALGIVAIRLSRLTRAHSELTNH